MSDPYDTIRFEADDLERFAAAGGDRNPLHVSPAYCRATAFGAPVVFGVLGAIAACGIIPARAGRRVRGVTLDFKGVVATGTTYTRHLVTDTEREARVEMRDGTRCVLTASVEFVAGTPPRLEAAGARFGRSESSDWQPGSEQMDAVTGRYGPERDALRALVARYGRGAAPAALDDATVATLLWASYAVGMERPGLRAMFCRLRVEIDRRAVGCAAPFEYRIDGLTFDDRFDLLRYDATIGAPARPFATAEVRAFVRRPAPSLDIDDLRCRLAPGPALHGRTALVTGASRGLGAAIAAALALRGCAVRANARSRRPGEATPVSAIRDGVGVRTGADAAAGVAGAIVPDPGDAGDAEWARAAAVRTPDLDYLVLNACPPTMPMTLGPASADRLQAYVDASLAMAIAPLTAFAPTLAARDGWLVVISSSYVDEAPGALPHYVCAKHALEGLAHATAAAHPSIGVLIVRPPKLRTELSNVPMGHVGAMAPEVVAASIANRLGSAAGGLGWSGGASSTISGQVEHLVIDAPRLSERDRRDRGAETALARGAAESRGLAA